MWTWGCSTSVCRWAAPLGHTFAFNNISLSIRKTCYPLKIIILVTKNKYLLLWAKFYGRLNGPSTFWFIYVHSLHLLTKVCVVCNPYNMEPAVPHWGHWPGPVAGENELPELGPCDALGYPQGLGAALALGTTALSRTALM